LSVAFTTSTTTTTTTAFVHLKQYFQKKKNGKRILEMGKDISLSLSSRSHR